MLNEDTPRKTSKADPGADTQVLVRFREDGDKPPLYFFPAGYGDMRLFREVAALLDDDQPVYGLQPPRAELVEGLHNKPAQWLISLYIMEIKRVQPKGPYHLAGYSSSGLFAAEAARQLIRKGDAVDLLVLLDPPVRIPAHNEILRGRQAKILLITYRVPWKGTVPQRVRIPPGKLSLQPVAIGADDGGNDIVRSTSVERVA